MELGPDSFDSSRDIVGLWVDYGAFVGGFVLLLVVEHLGARLTGLSHLIWWSFGLIHHRLLLDVRLSSLW